MKENITQADIESGLEDFTDVHLIEADKWILASILQKSIRRGDTAMALSAGKALWHVDRASFWRRVHTASIEDIGIGNIEAVTKCLSAYWQTSWRKQKDLEVGLSLIALMSKSIKCRVADELYLLLERDDNYQGLRTSLAKMTDGQLRSVISGWEFPTQALALWYLAGTDRFPSDFLKSRKGDREAVAKMLASLIVPAELNELCQSTLYRTQWPLTLFTPLICQKFGHEINNATVDVAELLPSKVVEGIPLWAVDQYSRLGKACIRKFMAAVPPLKRFTTAQVGMTVFYLEGALTDRTLRTPQLDAIRQGSELAMMFSLGLCAAEYLGLKETVRERFDDLDTIRAQQITYYVSDFRGGLI